MKKRMIVSSICLGMFLCGCGRNSSIKGFNTKIDLSKPFDDVVESLNDYEMVKKDDDFASFSNVALDSLTGCLSIRKSEENEKIDEISFYGFSLEDNLSLEEHLDILNNLYGDPIHKENYNDHTKNTYYYLYRDGNVNISVRIFNNDIDELTYKLISEQDKEILEEQKKLEKHRENDKNAQKNFDFLFDLAEIEDHPITEAMKKYDAKYEGIKEYNFALSSSKSIQFLANKEFLGYDTEVWFSVDDPYGDDKLAGFVGQIKTAHLAINLGKDSKEDFIKKFEEVFGKIIQDDNQEKVVTGPLLITIGNTTTSNDESAIYVSADINDSYFTIDPSFLNDEKTELISGYDDVDLSILRAEQDNDYRMVNKYSDNWRSCIDSTRKYVTEYLKAPATAKFCDDKEYKITKTGSQFNVEGYVDAENSFGAMIRTDFSLNLDSDFNVISGTIGDILV